MLLNNVRILDLTQYIPGPYITRMLADLGAEVIKVEPPAGDPMRFFSGAADKNISKAYVALNHGKKIIRLNLKDDQGLSKLKELLVSADVLIDGFRPGTLDRLGLNRQVITRINSGLIHCALTGFGQTGPLAQKAGHDLGYCAVAGMLGSHRGSHPPEIIFPPLADHVGALQASNSILAALFSRTQTGAGTFIDASLYEPVLAWQYLAQSQHISQVLGGDAAYYNVYQTGDGKFITLSTLEFKFWEQFCTAVNKPHWVNRHSDDYPQSELISELAEFFNTLTLQKLDNMLGDFDCCFEAVANIENVYAHPQTAGRGIIDHYPNIINGRILAADEKLNEIADYENISWD